jgi:hypothetical protein
MNKLKEYTIEYLRGIDSSDAPFVFAYGRQWSTNELATEIENETEIGLKQMQMFIDLTCDLIKGNKVRPYTFALSIEQEKKFVEWKNSFKDVPREVTGANFGLKIIFTGIGDAVFGFNWKGDEIDLTEVETW